MPGTQWRVKETLGSGLGRFGPRYPVNGPFNKSNDKKIDKIRQVCPGFEFDGVFPTIEP